MRSEPADPQIEIETAPLPGRGVDPVETVLRRAVLVIAIGLSALLGYFTTYALLVVLGLVALYFVARRASIAVPFDPAARLFLFCFVLLFIAAAFTMREPADLLQTLNFAGLLFYAPLAALLRRASAAENSRKVADFALFGTAAGLLVSMYFTYVEGQARAGLGSFFTDPIRLSNTALILGFFGMLGAAATGGRARFVYFIGPLMALAVIFACGTRSALIAFAMLLFVAALLLVRRRLMAVLVSVGLAAGFALLGFVADVAGARSSTLFDIVGRLASGDDPADLGTAIRFILYRAGSGAFLDSPLVGYGWGRLMSSITPYLAPEDLVHAQLPHLHDDALNFAVAAGVFGIAVYLVLLATPIVSCLRAPRDNQYRARLYGGTLLTVSYFVLGLPDTMLSFALHNTLYVVLTAVLLNYCRDGAASQKP